MADEDLGPVEQDLGPPKTRRQAAGEMFTDIPKEIRGEVQGALNSIFGFGEWAKGEGAQEATPGSVMRGIGKGAAALGSAAYLGTGVGPGLVGAAKSMIGHGYEAATGTQDPQDYEGVKTGVDIGGALYGGGALLRKGAQYLRGPKAPTELPHAESAATHSQFEAELMNRSLDPEGVMRGAEEGGALMQHGLRRAAEMERKQIEGQFQLSGSDFGGTAKPASIHTDVVMGMPQQMTKDLQASRIQIIEGQTPQAARMLKDINRNVNALVKRNSGVPSAGKVTNINLAAIDAAKQRMNIYRRAAMESGNKKDMAAAQKIMESFDKQVDGWVNGQKFSGDPRAVQAWNVARQRENIYRNTFESGGRNPVGETVEKIIGENKHSPQTGRAAADYAIGSIGTNPPGYNAKVMTGIRNILGPNSPEWAATRQATFMNLIQPNPRAWEPRQVKTRLLEFLDGKGKEVSQAMYSPKERAVMRQFADLQGYLDTARLRGSGGGASQVPMKIAMSVAQMIVRSHDFKSKLVHTGLTMAEAHIREAKELNELQGKIGQVRQSVAKWWNQVSPPPSKAVNPRQQRLKTYTATAALASSLRRLGIDNIAPQRQAAEDGKVNKVSFGGPQF